MDDFESAFRLGIAAANDVKYKKDEVESVLKEFSASLEVESNGALGVAVEKIPFGFSGILNGFTSQPLAAGFGLFVITKEEPRRSAQVAGWKQSRDGYPCWITVAGQETACLDRTGLKEELARLAASPHMGSAIIGLLAANSSQAIFHRNDFSE